MEEFKSEENREPTRSEKIALFENKMSRVNDYIRTDNEKLDYYTDVVQPKIIGLGKKIVASTGYDPISFIFWHKLIGSSLLKDEIRTMFLDTPGGDIEKFVDGLLLEITE